MDETARYHVARKGAKQGVFTLAEIREGLGTQRFLPSDHCWTTGMGPWVTLAQLLGEPAAAVPPATSRPVPVSGTAPKHPSSPPSPPAKESPPARRPVSPGWRCLSCKGTFAQPNTPVSGYDTLWKSFGYFIGSMACLVFGMILCGGLSSIAQIIGGGSLLAGNVAVGLIGLLFVLASMVLSFMSAFEFVSASVHHGIYRSGQPDRCPHCTSTLILRS